MEKYWINEKKKFDSMNHTSWENLPEKIIYRIEDKEVLTIHKDGINLNVPIILKKKPNFLGRIILKILGIKWKV